MRRRFDRGGRSLFSEGDANPLSGVSNLADVMLVLAVGIMLALIMNLHLSINAGSVTQMDQSEMKEVDQSQFSTSTENSESDSNLQEKGTVYVDKNTGKMYLVEQNGK